MHKLLTVMMPLRLKCKILKERLKSDKKSRNDLNSAVKEPLNNKDNKVSFIN